MYFKWKVITYLFIYVIYIILKIMDTTKLVSLSLLVLAMPCGCGSLVSQQGIEPGLSAMKAWHPNQWNTQYISLNLRGKFICLSLCFLN